MPAYDLDAVLRWFGGSSIHHRTLGRDELLFVRGSPAEHIYFILSGEIRAEVTLESGETIVFFRAKEGAALGEETFQFPQYLYTAIANVETQVRYIRAAEIADHIPAHSSFARSLIQCLARRYGESLMLRELLSVKPAVNRLRTWLHWQSISHNEPIDLKKRMGTIGAEIGMTRESVYRAFAKLEESGEIRRESGMVYLLSHPSNLSSQ